MRVNKSTIRVVPTWNYRVVHVTGSIQKIEDPKYLRGILTRLTRTRFSITGYSLENGGCSEWFYWRTIEKIVAIEIEISSIIGKFKVSQNRSKVDAEMSHML